MNGLGVGEVPVTSTDRRQTTCEWKFFTAEAVTDSLPAGSAEDGLLVRDGVDHKAGMEEDGLLVGQGTSEIFPLNLARMPEKCFSKYV